MNFCMCAMGFTLRTSPGQNVPGQSRWIRGKTLFSEQEEYLGLHTLPKGVWIFQTSKADWHKWERWLNETYALARIRLMKDCWQSSQCFWLREKKATDEEYITGDGKEQIKGIFHHGSKSLLFKVAHHTLLQEIDEIPQCSSRFCLRSDQTPRETKASQWLMI